MIGLKFSLGKQSILFWRFMGTLVALPLFFLCGILLSFRGEFGIALSIIVVSIYFLYVFWYVPGLFQASQVLLEEGRLTWRTGMIFRVSITLRLENILTAAISQSPFQQMMGLCTLSVRPVGAPISMRQLSKEDALVLLRIIEEAAND